MQLIITILAALLLVPAHALDVTGTVGVDHWHTDAEPVRYLDNYRPLSEPYRPTSPWLSVSASHGTPTPWGPLTATVAGRFSRNGGGYLSRADLDWRFNLHAGVRIGMLPYRVSTCRAPGEGPWIAEPSAVCRHHTLNAMATGAAGVQLYGTAVAGAWLIDGLAGVYRPRVDGQSWRTFGPLLATDGHTRDRRSGLSLNTLHLPTGVQLRASLLRADEQQSGRWNINTHTVYVAAEAPLAPWLSLRASVTDITADTNYGLRIAARDTTTETVLHPAPQHTLAVAWSQYRHDNHGLDNTHRIVQSTSITWRWDAPTALRLALIGQLTTSSDNGQRGSALGLRLQQSF